MQALVLREAAKTPHLEDVDEPLAASGEQVVEVVAAALNPVDIAQASNDDGHLPRGVGIEAVVATDEGFAYAERAVPPSGSIAELTVVDADALVPLPVGVSPSAAVSLGIPGVAAWMSLADVGRLAPGETVVVLGATGAAGYIAVQVAKILGAARVVATGRRAEALEPLTDLGADAIAVLGDGDDTTAIRDAAGGEVDLVFDPLFGKPLMSAVRALRPGGRSVTIGMSAGAVAEVPFEDFLGRQLLSHLNMTAPGEATRNAYRELVEHLSAGRLVTESEDIPLRDVERAWQRQQQGPQRKLVIRP